MDFEFINNIKDSEVYKTVQGLLPCAMTFRIHHIEGEEP